MLKCLNLTDDELLRLNNLTKIEYKFVKLNQKQKILTLLKLISCDDELEFLDTFRDSWIQEALGDVGLEISTCMFYDDVSENRLLHYWKFLDEKIQLDLIVRSIGENSLQGTFDSYFNEYYELFDMDNDQEIWLNYYCGGVIHLEDAKNEILENIEDKVIKEKIDDFLGKKELRALMIYLRIISKNLCFIP